MSALCEHLVHTMKHMFCVKWTRLTVCVLVPTSQHFLPPVSNLEDDITVLCTKQGYIQISYQVQTTVHRHLNIKNKGKILFKEIPQIMM